MQEESSKLDLKKVAPPCKAAKAKTAAVDIQINLRILFGYLLATP
jgi:hypothetical protein